MTIYDYEAKQRDGNQISLNIFKGKVLIYGRRDFRINFLRHPLF